MHNSPIQNTPEFLSVLHQLPELLSVCSPHTLDTLGLPLGTIFRETTLTRDALLSVVGKGTSVGPWCITYDAEYDRLNYTRIKPLARPAALQTQGVLTSPVVRTAPQPIDGPAVGAKARRYIDAELKAGREVSATEAVSVILKHN
jgi:hypothetical protein